MIVKSFLILSILANMLGLTSLADRFDNSVLVSHMGEQKVAEASELGLDLPLPNIEPRPIVKPFSPDVSANAHHYVLVDLDTDVVLAKNDEKAQVPIASTTKIMTALLSLENYQLSDVVTVPKEAPQEIGASANLRTGEKITVENLLNCMLIPSGNDAAYTLASHMSGDDGNVSKFVEAMNKKAAEFGMQNTHYQDPAGLNTTGYSSAYDLFLVTKQALKYDKFREIIKKESWVAHNIDNTISHEVKQSNRLVTDYHYPGAIGVKTGFMPEAGHCLVGAATRDGHTLVSIVLNTYADTPTASANEARRLLDWGFANVEWKS